MFLMNIILGDIAASTNGRVSGSATVATISVIANGDGSLVPNASDTPMAVEGDGDADNDDGKTYCICDTVSYGEMIGCDDDNCERQWVCALFLSPYIIELVCILFSSISRASD